jgi:NAD(P)H dehydrogenase (quinone)
MAEAVATGARDVQGADVVMRRVLETPPGEVREKIGAIERQKAFEYIPVFTISELGQADAILFGIPPPGSGMCVARYASS